MKALYITLFVLGAFLSNAQSNLYTKLNSYLSTNTKEKVQNRLIAVNVWSVNDQNSREINKEFSEAYTIFANAKLKGGNKGIIVLNVTLDQDNVITDITLKKDGVKTIRIPNDNSDIINAIGAASNVVFDENGNKVFENINKGSVVTSIQSLITR